MFKFHGESDHTLDDKGRVIIPVKYRDALADGWFLTRGSWCRLSVLWLIGVLRLDVADHGRRGCVSSSTCLVGSDRFRDIQLIVGWLHSI